MAMLQELSIDQIDGSIADAADRRVPAVLTIRTPHGWANLRSRMLAVSDNRLYLELPIFEPGTTPHEFAPAEKVGVSFKLKHYKHIFHATVAGMEKHPLDGGEPMTILSVCMPTRMHRLQRRAYLRVGVPTNRIVRAAFWLGGREAEPSGASTEKPVWFGRVANLSAGGFQLVTQSDVADVLEVGDCVGLRISFGAGADETVYGDAQFRHAETDDSGALLGFQFIALDQTAQGRKALQIISSKVSEYQRLQERSFSSPPSNESD